MKNFTLPVLGFLLLASISAKAQLVTVNFDAPGSLTSDGGVNYTGAGADTGGVTSEYWNPIGSSGDLAADGTTHTGITFTNTIGDYYNYGSPSPIALFNPYLDGGGAGGQIETLNDVPTGTYDVYIYDQNGGFASRGAEVTLGGTTQYVSNNGDQSTFIEGTNYTEFTNVTLASTGSISFEIQAWHGVGQSDTEADFNGVQLVQLEVPEPSTWAMLLAGAGLAIFFVRTRRFVRL